MLKIYCTDSITDVYCRLHVKFRARNLIRFIMCYDYSNLMIVQYFLQFYFTIYTLNKNTVIFTEKQFGFITIITFLLNGIKNLIPVALEFYKNHF